MPNQTALKITLCLTALAQIPTTFARDRYDGPDTRIRRYESIPSVREVCRRYDNKRGDGHSNQDREESARSACRFGMSEARQMAEYFARHHGRIDGYESGYAWGLYKFADIYGSDPIAMSEGRAQAYLLESELSYALSEASSEGRSDGKTQGSQDARGRFHNAVNTGVYPSNEFDLPTITFSPNANAYSQYVGAIPSVEDVLRSRGYDELTIYRDYDETWGGDLQRRRPHDMWRNDGVHTHRRANIIEGKKAFSRWANRKLGAYRRYSKLNENAPRNENGDIVVNFQKVFESAFVNSYAKLSDYFYSRAFNSQIDNGYFDGREIGRFAGFEIAKKKGMSHAFNRSYLEEAPSKYQVSFLDSYRSSFLDTYDYYANNSKISIEFLEIIGEVEDGIIQPGEKIAVRYRVTNVGGQGADLAVKVKGDVVNDESFGSRVQAITSKEEVTDFIATIDPRLNPRENATVVLDINGLTTYRHQEVNRQLELKRIAKEVNIGLGAGKISATIENVSTTSTAGEISANLYLDGELEKTVYGQQMGEGQSQVLVIPFDGIDPLKLIESSVKATIEVKMNSLVVDTYSVTLESRDYMNDYVSYLDQLLNGKAFVPSHIDAEERLIEVKKTIVERNSDQVDEHDGMFKENIWKQNPLESWIGAIVNAKENRDQSETAVEEYHKLGKTLHRQYKKLSWRLFKKRGSYKKLCNKLHKDGKEY